VVVVVVVPVVEDVVVVAPVVVVPVVPVDVVPVVVVPPPVVADITAFLSPPLATAVKSLPPSVEVVKVKVVSLLVRRNDELPPSSGATKCSA